MSFKENGFQIVRQALSKETCQLLTHQFEITKDVIYYVTNRDKDEYVSDRLVEQCFSCHGAICFEGLLLLLKQQIEDITKVELDPTYSYSRIYYNKASLTRHIDRPSCEYSTTICIKNDKEPWAFHIKSLDGAEHSVLLEEGDMVIYRGTELEHWRETYEGTRQVQVFLHYVDKNGIYAEYKNDFRPMLGLPKY